ERQHRPVRAIEVVVDEEIAREAPAGEIGLVPVAVVALRLGEEGRGAGSRGRTRLARRDQAQERPRRLRSGRDAAAVPSAALFAFVIRAAVLSEAAVFILDRLEPSDGAAQDRVLGRKAGGLECWERRTRSVQVVGSPASEPGSIGLLLSEEVIDPPLNRVLVAGLSGKKLD